MAAINNSVTALNALYASALAVKLNYAASVMWSSGGSANGPGTVLRNGAGVFVRLETYGNPSGWAEGSSSASQAVLRLDGVLSPFSARGANPYNHTASAASPRLLAKKFNSTLNLLGYDPCQITYIPLAS